MYIKSLESEIKKINHKYPMIDWGGCGTFSYHLSRKLDSENISNEIVYIPEEKTPENAHRCDVRFQHIFVKVGDYLVDNHGYKNISNYKVLALEKERLKDMLEDKKLWNNIFPHEKWSCLASDILDMKISLK